ncbi:hypothetical protein RchiOBHm_Chr1g0333891 [Rosa chinensis]|uniref:Uncharacterized protein n=1 Tax=Rosa chinensis TaxID=74649 RepID=A0A2P6SC74_ROSCH|nr:hypothetical protein RchiOBHm_Chr1g0333891 [Rosa chinensis]
MTKESSEGTKICEESSSYQKSRFIHHQNQGTPIRVATYVNINRFKIKWSIPLNQEQAWRKNQRIYLQRL